MTWREISAQQLNSLKSRVVIDVRSPGEHAQERIPDAINVPLLSDDERAQVGTTYKQQGEMLARRQALKIISPKIPTLIEDISARYVHGQAVVVHCWRGGLRSESVASVLSIAGIDCYRLTGGYKSWRSIVLSDFASDAFPFQAIVLHGLTGVGKTELLQALASKGCQVLDLEMLSNHRGSVFGGLGLGDQPSQKNFEGYLWQSLKELQPGPVFIEAESRKIGKLSLPDCVFQRIQTGIPVLVTGTVARRAERIAADYLHPSKSPERELKSALALLEQMKANIGSRLVTEIRELVGRAKITQAVTLLLTEHYDPHYSRQIERVRPFPLEICSDELDIAASELITWSKEAEGRPVTSLPP